MSTATLLETTDQSTGHDDGLHHGAHVACQIGNPFVTVACGRVAGWEDMGDAGDRALCPLCWNTERCPNCGTRLRRRERGK